MKKNIVAVLLLITAISFGACAQRKTAKGNGSANTITQVSIERTPCFGRCPSYKVDVMANGMVRYTGKQFAEYQGVYEKQMPVAEVNELFAQVAKYHVDTCKEQYDVLVSDLPGMNFHVKYQSADKYIQNANYGPMYLRTLATMVDELAKVDNTWKRIGDVPPNNNR